MKAYKYDSDDEDIEFAYLASRIVRDMKKSGQFQRRGSSSKKGSNFEVCHKCGSPENFIKDCPIHKMDYKDYLKDAGDKGKLRDQVPKNSRRKAAAGYGHPEP